MGWIVLQPRWFIPVASPHPLPPFCFLTLSTCQASDQMLTRVMQETGAAQGRFQPLTIDGRLMWER